MDIRSVVELQEKPDVADFNVGDTIKVGFKIVEGEKQRVQNFTGIVMRIRDTGISGTFTVRQTLHGVGVERTFPYNSPRLDKVEVVTRAKVRRAKLYYLRGLSRKKTRMKVKTKTR